MGDTCSQPTHRSKAIATAHFTFKPAKLGTIFKRINVADGSLLWNHQRGNVNIEGLFRSRRREAANFTLNGKRVNIRKPIKKQLRDVPPINGGCRALQNFLPRSIHQRNAAFKISGDERTANGVDHVLMKRLKTEQFAAFVAKFNAGLSQL